MPHLPWAPATTILSASVGLTILNTWRKCGSLHNGILYSHEKEVTLLFTTP